MRVLFLHSNFPAQFGTLARYLTEQGHDVTFGTSWDGARPDWVRLVRFSPHREVRPKQHPYLVSTEGAVLLGQAFARAAWQLKADGYAPDCIVGHAGSGVGLYVRDVWPEARYVGYFEWYYRSRGADVGFLDGNVSPDNQHRVRTRNAPILLDLAACNVGIVPTEYQAAQFPPFARPRLIVQHDGVDTDYFAPQARRLTLPGLDLAQADEIVTYVARGQEPYRGFPQAMTAFAEVQKRRPGAHIVVVGEDRVAYGKNLPDGDTYRQKMLRELDLDRDRIHFTGLLGRDHYRDVLLASSVHVYLTVPFVLSWSMIEALSAGCVVVASNTDPVLEVVRDGENGLLVDFFDTGRLADRICDVLERPDAFAALRENARRTTVERYAASRLVPLRARLLELAAAGMLGDAGN